MSEGSAGDRSVKTSAYWMIPALLQISALVSYNEYLIVGRAMLVYICYGLVSKYIYVRCGVSAWKNSVLLLAANISTDYTTPPTSGMSLRMLQVSTNLSNASLFSVQSSFPTIESKAMLLALKR